MPATFNQEEMKVIQDAYNQYYYRGTFHLDEVIADTARLRVVLEDYVIYNEKDSIPDYEKQMFSLAGFDSPEAFEQYLLSVYRSQREAARSLLEKL